MRTKIFLTTALIIAGLYSCTENKIKETERIETPSASEEHHHEDSDSIELNNGAKWKVVPEMMTYIKNMETEIAQFSDDGAGLTGYKDLGIRLQKNIDLLTSKCTMEGKAHDELHKWLLPYIDMVGKLNESKNLDEAKTILNEIKNSFVTFNNFFE